MADDRHCPECGDVLHERATRCACGWGAPKRRESAPVHNMTCTWRYDTLHCRYPVGFFDVGMHAGFCLLHRATPGGATAARIAEDSQLHTPAEYEAIAKAHVYGKQLSRDVRALQERVRARVQRDRAYAQAARELAEKQAGE